MCHVYHDTLSKPTMTDNKLVGTGSVFIVSPTHHKPLTRRDARNEIVEKHGYDVGDVEILAVQGDVYYVLAKEDE